MPIHWMWSFPLKQPRAGLHALIFMQQNTPYTGQKCVVIRDQIRQLHILPILKHKTFSIFSCVKKTLHMFHKRFQNRKVNFIFRPKQGV